jgi:hypothetical protein
MPLEMSGDDGVPLVFGHIEEHALPQDPGHGHDAVDPAPRLEGRGNETRTGFHLRDVVGEGDRLATGRRDLGHHRVGHLAARILPGHTDPEIGDDHLGSLSRGGQRHGAPDAATATGDRDHLACEEPCHRRSPDPSVPGMSGPQ